MIKFLDQGEVNIPAYVRQVEKLLRSLESCDCIPSTPRKYRELYELVKGVNPRIRVSFPREPE